MNHADSVLTGGPRRGVGDGDRSSDTPTTGVSRGTAMPRTPRFFVRRERPARRTLGAALTPPGSSHQPATQRRCFTWNTVSRRNMGLVSHPAAGNVTPAGSGPPPRSGGVARRFVDKNRLRSSAVDHGLTDDCRPPSVAERVSTNILLRARRNRFHVEHAVNYAMLLTRTRPIGRTGRTSWCGLTTRPRRRKGVLLFRPADRIRHPTGHDIEHHHGPGDEFHVKRTGVS